MEAGTAPFTSHLAAALAEDLLERFLRYVRVDTQSARDRTGSPSTPGQLDLARMLVDELIEAGLADASLDENGYVMATLASTIGSDAPVIGLIAHVDTSPDAPGAGVEPIVHRTYDGGVVELPREGTVLDPASMRGWGRRPATTSSPRAATRCSARTTRPAWPRSWRPSRTWPRTRSCCARRFGSASRPTRRWGRERSCST